MDVSRVVLGCGNFGGVGSDLSLVGRADEEGAAFALMDAAWERGIRAFDTASSYGGGASERMIGRWIASRRPAGLRLTSKVFHPVHEGDDSGLAPERVRRVVHESLANLGVERIDRYLIHEPDPLTPLGDTLEALAALVEEGRIGGIGLTVARRRKIPFVVTVHGGVYDLPDAVRRTFNNSADRAGRDALRPAYDQRLRRAPSRRSCCNWPIPLA